MSTIKFLSVAVTAAVSASATPVLTDWASHGEALDAATLAKPALLDPAALNARAGRTWRAGVNERFVGATVADAKVLLGVLQDVKGAEVLPAKKFTADELRDVPAEFDWRTDPRADKCPSLKEIRDQANCGSCWAFGSVEAMTDRAVFLDEHTPSTSARTSRPAAHRTATSTVSLRPYTYYQSTGVVTGGNYGTRACATPAAPRHHTNSTNSPCPAVSSLRANNFCTWGGMVRDKHLACRATGLRTGRRSRR